MTTSNDGNKGIKGIKGIKDIKDIKGIKDIKDMKDMKGVRDMRGMRDIGDITDNKEHSVEAILKECVVDNHKKTPPSEFDHWLHYIETHKGDQEPSLLENRKADYQLIYFLTIVFDKKPCLSVQLVVAKKLKKGGFGNSYKPLSYSSDTHMKALTSFDHDILHRLEVAKRISNPFYHYRVFDEEYELVGETAKTIFEDILKTGRCYWENHQGHAPLHLEEPKTGNFSWSIVENGKQKLTCRVNGEEVQVLPITPFFYLNVKDNSCGILENF